MAETQGDIRPIPDPTLLTTEASVRLEAALRALIQSEIAHQNDLFTEKLALVEMRFNMLDARTAEQKQDTTNALTAALAAQKEQELLQTTSAQKNTDKSELATTERIKGIEALLVTSMKAIDDKIGDLKDRVIAIEAAKHGNVEGIATVRANSTNIQAIIASIIGVILGVIAIAAFLISVLKP